MAAPPTLTSTARMVDRIVGGLEEYLREARRQGLTHQAIRDQLVADHGVDLTPQTVGNWCRNLGIDEAKP